MWFLRYFQIIDSRSKQANETGEAKYDCTYIFVITSKYQAIFTKKSLNVSFMSAICTSTHSMIINFLYGTFLYGGWGWGGGHNIYVAIMSMYVSYFSFVFTKYHFLLNTTSADQYSLCLWNTWATLINSMKSSYHGDVMRWKHFPRNWPFVRGIHRSPVNSPHKGRWHEALMFSLICVCVNDWVNNREAGDLRRYRAH